MTARLLKIITRSGIKPVIDSVYKWDQAVEALEHLDSGRQLGKIVIEVE